MSDKQPQHSFSCDFGGGLAATATIDAEALRQGRGKTQFLSIEWTGNRRPGILPAYKAWMLTVQQRAAELLSDRILWTIQTGANQWEFYALEPGKPPQRLDGPGK